jgi:UDP-galactose transporter B1
MEMFEHINKWVTILSFTYALVSGQFKMAVNFNSKHPQLATDFFILSILTTVGQVFVYRMIKQFKQHIVPFVITTRKIFTVVISIIFYGHETSLLQYAAIALIFCTASYEYLSEIYGKKEDAQPTILPVIHTGSTTMLEEEI